MSTEEVIFKHPPATEVQLGIAFPNNFDVADQRSLFFKLVRTEFPIVIMPEQSKMPYDFADYSLQREDTAERIEVGMNYFRLTSSRYPGFRKFQEVFIKVLSSFFQCYEIPSFTHLSMFYQNVLPLEVHQKYKDCFALNVSLPETQEPDELFAGQGLLVFQKPQGFVTVQLEPKVEGTQIKSYAMNLFFTTRPDSPSQHEKTLVADFTDTAHNYLKQFFFRILTKQYLDYLSKR
jgi:uncharacterized protein (TIGR04255 family)